MIMSVIWWWCRCPVLSMMMVMMRDDDLFCYWHFLLARRAPWCRWYNMSQIKRVHRRARARLLLGMMCSSRCCSRMLRIIIQKASRVDIRWYDDVANTHSCVHQFICFQYNDDSAKCIRYRVLSAGCRGYAAKLFTREHDILFNDIHNIYSLVYTQPRLRIFARINVARFRLL